MSSSYDGEFTAELMCLKLQLNSLFDSVGGEQSLKLLDQISILNKSEKEIVLKTFNQVLKKVVEGETRLNDQEKNNFEENLYQSILQAMREAAKAPPKPKLQVINGRGESQNSKFKKIVKFEAGKSKEAKLTLLN